VANDSFTASNVSLAGTRSRHIVCVDWFGDLERLGLGADEVKRQAPRVWRENAQRFMSIWRADYGRPGLPYGAKQWGLPHDH